MKRELEDIKRDLSHVYWIGGASRGGKTTVAEAIVDEFLFSIYHHDEKWLNGDHAQMADPERHPAMFKLRDFLKDWNIQKLQSYFENSPVDELVETQIDFFTEEFEMVVDDLYELPRDKPIIAEGAGLLPEQVSRVTTPDKAIWLVATEAFERKKRPWEDHKSESWYDKMIEWSTKRKERVVSHAERLGLKVVVTDGNRSIEDTINLVKSHFGLCSNAT
jgi:adenylate kinase family enzyme